MPQNRQFRLAKRPSGVPGDDVWNVTEEDAPAPADGEVLVRVEHISMDPAMRGWIKDVRSYMPPVAVGDVMRALGEGVVVESRSDKLRAGDHVTGAFGVQRYAVARAGDVTPIDVTVAPVPVLLGVLGMTGLTAYFGLFDIGKPEAGNTVVVSAAAGAVGQVAGQLARIHGCRVIGIAGGPEKCRFVVDELRFDAVIDYKSEHVQRRLHELCPKGIDVYFDNVGGDILDAALSCLARHARVVICGAVSQYNAGRMQGPANYMMLLVQRARMEGFLVFDYAHRYGEAQAAMMRWRNEGLLRSREDVMEGIDRFPEALRRLLAGESFGKLVVRV